MLVMLGSTAQAPSLLNFFFDMPDVTGINFLWYATLLGTIFVMLESVASSLLGYAVLIGLPLTFPLLIKFILLAHSDVLFSIGLVAP